MANTLGVDARDLKLIGLAVASQSETKVACTSISQGTFLSILASDNAAKLTSDLLCQLQECPPLPQWKKVVTGIREHV